MKSFLTRAALLMLIVLTVQPAHALETIAAGASTVAIPIAKADLLQIQLDNAQFSDWTAKRLELDLKTIDIQAGTLKGVNLRYNDGIIERLPIQQFSLNSLPLANGVSAVSFDAFELVNFQRLVLRQPIAADVRIVLSEAGLNQFLSSPETIQKLESQLAKQTGIALATFNDVSIRLSRGNVISVSMSVTLAQALQANMTLTGKLVAKNGGVEVTRLKMESNGNPFPFDVSGILTEQINKTLDVKRFTKKSGIALTVNQIHLTGSTLTLVGVGQVNRLSFGSGK
jgi:hypothetical protein